MKLDTILRYLGCIPNLDHGMRILGYHGASKLARRNAGDHGRSGYGQEQSLLIERKGGKFPTRAVEKKRPRRAR